MNLSVTNFFETGVDIYETLLLLDFPVLKELGFAKSP